MQFILDRFSKEVKNDKMGMMAAIRKDSRAISLVSPVLQKDRRNGSTGSSTSDGSSRRAKATGDGTSRQSRAEVTSRIGGLRPRVTGRIDGVEHE
jgi:hypothetical protein